MKKIAFLLLIVSVVMINACGSGDKPNKEKKSDAVNADKYDLKSDDKTAKTPKPMTSTSSSDSDDDQKEPITFTDEQLKTAKQIVKKVASADLSGIDAKKLFRGKCGSCHGLNGKLGLNGAGDLTQSKLSIEESIALMYYGRNMMTEFNGILSSAEMMAVAKYVKETFQ